jgi:hypothetical protein
MMKSIGKMISKRRLRRRNRLRISYWSIQSKKRQLLHLKRRGKQTLQTSRRREK